MDGTLLGARLLLAAVFAVAGAAKLADLSGSRRAVAGFGMPETLAQPVGLLLPLVEIAVAIALLPQPAAWYGALGALVLLLLFVAGISVNISRGKTPDCHCFGQLHSEPVGPTTLIRNAILAVIAALIVVQGRSGVGPDAVAWLGSLTTAERAGVALALVALVLLALQSWFLFRVVQQNTQLLHRLGAVASGTSIGAEAGDESGLPVGGAAPDFQLPDVRGMTVTLSELRAEGKPVMLIFANPSCGPCSALMPEIGQWQRQYSAQLTLVVISLGSPEDNLLTSTQYGLSPMLLQQDREIEESYEVLGTPGAVIVQHDGTIGSAVAMGADAIRTLLGTVVPPPVSQPIPLLDELPSLNGSAAAPAQLQIGDPVPEVELIDLTGRTVSITDFYDRDTLVLFWSSSCGFCRQLEPDLLAWEADPPEDAPRLLVLLPSTSPGNQVVRFHSPVVIDRDDIAMKAFAAYGTPMAVLVKADGTIGSEIAAGGAAVLALARGQSDREESVTLS